MLRIGRANIVAIALCLSLGLAPVARAEIIATFWSQDLGRNFPHAFFTLHGAKADGTKVRASYGFTAKALTPAILFGTVPGRIDEATDRYISRSTPHFSRVLTDPQYDAIMNLVSEWGENGDHRYRLNSRNCVHFVAEAMRRAGLVVVESQKLMKKPGSFIQRIEHLNVGRVRPVELQTSQYLEWPDETAKARAPNRISTLLQ